MTEHDDVRATGVPLPFRHARAHTWPTPVDPPGEVVPPAPRRRGRAWASVVVTALLAGGVYGGLQLSARDTVVTTSATGPLPGSADVQQVPAPEPSIGPLPEPVSLPSGATSTAPSAGPSRAVAEPRTLSAIAPVATTSATPAVTTAPRARAKAPVVPVATARTALAALPTAGDLAAIAAGPWAAREDHPSGIAIGTHPLFFCQGVTHQLPAHVARQFWPAGGFTGAGIRVRAIPYNPGKGSGAVDSVVKTLNRCAVNEDYRGYPVHVRAVQHTGNARSLTETLIVRRTPVVSPQGSDKGNDYVVVRRGDLVLLADLGLGSRGPIVRETRQLAAVLQARAARALR